MTRCNVGQPTREMSRPPPGIPPGRDIPATFGKTAHRVVPRARGSSPPKRVVAGPCGMDRRLGRPERARVITAWAGPLRPFRDGPPAGLSRPSAGRHRLGGSSRRLAGTDHPRRRPTRARAITTRAGPPGEFRGSSPLMPSPPAPEASPPERLLPRSQRGPPSAPARHRLTGRRRRGRAPSGGAGCLSSRQIVCARTTSRTGGNRQRYGHIWAQQRCFHSIKRCIRRGSSIPLSLLRPPACHVHQDDSGCSATMHFTVAIAIGGPVARSSGGHARSVTQARCMPVESFVERDLRSEPSVLCVGIWRSSRSGRTPTTVSDDICYRHHRSWRPCRENLVVVVLECSRPLRVYTRITLTGAICDPHRTYFESTLCALDAPGTSESADRTERRRCVRRAHRLSLTAIARQAGIRPGAYLRSPSTGAILEYGRNGFAYVVGELGGDDARRPSIVPIERNVSVE